MVYWLISMTALLALLALAALSVGALVYALAPAKVQESRGLRGRRR